MRNFIAGTVCVAVLMSVLPAHAYLMQILSYSNLFERADVVVIATPMETKDSSTSLKLEVEQPKEVTALIKTVETTFEIGVPLKGEISGDTFRLLHLSRKDKQAAMMFGAVGTFFIDFHSEHNKSNSFLLFMKKRQDGTFYPAWRPMEGSRAIIPIKRDKTL